jgi:hypothetical protein
MRNGLLHFPTSFVYRRGNLNEVPIVGVLSEGELEADFLNRIK